MSAVFMNDAQRQLKERIVSELSNYSFVMAGFLIGSFATDSSDDLSDLDICFIVDDSYWDKASRYTRFLSEEMGVIYSDRGQHGNQGSFARYIFSNFTSAEIHFISASSDYELFYPYQALFDKSNVIGSFIQVGRPPGKSGKPALSLGPDSAAWDVFNLFKTAVRGDFEGILSWAEKLVLEHKK